jgi:hypothetical protein
MPVLNVVSAIDQPLPEMRLTDRKKNPKRMNFFNNPRPAPCKDSEQPA